MTPEQSIKVDQELPLLLPFSVLFNQFFFLKYNAKRTTFAKMKRSENK